MAGFLYDLLSGDRRIMKQVEKTAHEVVAYEDEMRALSDESLRAKTTEFKERFAQGESLDDLLPEAYAVVREAAYRVVGEFPYLVQIIGGVILHRGDIAEMKTGEGKTLTSIMPVYLNALGGEGVHVITVNEYLAKRDAAWMGSIHEFLGLTVGVNLRELSKGQKRDAYESDITYTTNAELGFDYLRDNMVTRKSDRVLRGLNFALADEVDSILIDESRTPLIISGGEREGAKLYEQTDRFAKKLTEGADFVVDVKSKTVQLTDAGVEKAERSFKIDNLYDLDHASLVHHISNALKANFIMLKDIEYVVQDNQVVIVDQFTGRLMEGREYSDGLHQAISAKEKVTIRQEAITLATVTYQNFFRLYKKLSGMTGTAKTEEEEFLEIYNMRVLVIPTNRPIVRDDQTDLIFGTKKAKFEALVNEVKAIHETGQPILVGTVAVETSEYISMMLTQRKIKHEVLNAKNHAREAMIIENAGKAGSVTIATNMAGRGTDIKLNDESRALGGLAVIGSERHESRRIDNQLRGRSGRQGDPGSSRFFVSFEDDLMRRYGSDRLEGVVARLGDVAVENNMLTKQVSQAQRRVEGVNFDIRKTLLDYDDVLRQQREIMYEQRDYVLDNDDVHAVVREMFERVVSDTVASYRLMDSKNGGIDLNGLKESLVKLSLVSEDYDIESFNGLDEAGLVEKITNEAWAHYEEKISDVKEQFASVENDVVLQSIDRAWVDHIDSMAKLREGIHLRSYAQDKPLQAYVQEGFQMFEEMLSFVAQNIVSFCMNVKIDHRQG